MCRFLLGLGVGSVLGAVAYRMSRTEKAKELKKRMCCAAQSAADKAGEWMTGVKEKAAEAAQKMADDAKDKYHAYTEK